MRSRNGRIYICKCFVDSLKKNITLKLNQSEYDRASKDQTYLRGLIKNKEIEAHAQLSVESECQLLADTGHVAESPESYNTLQENETTEDLTPEIEIETTQEETDGQYHETTKSLYMWTKPCVDLLLSLYEDNKENFEGSTGKTHKEIWKKIAGKMKEVNDQYVLTGGQCQSKFMSLKKTYKRVHDHNTKSGSDKRDWIHYDRMDEIFQNCAWVSPPAIATDAGPTIVPVVPSDRAKPSRKRKDTELIDRILSERKKKPEEREQQDQERQKRKDERFEKYLKMKQEQHKEKMEFLKTIFSNKSNK